MTRSASDLGDPWLTGVLREAFSAVAARERWELAAVAVAGERTGQWLSGARAASSFHIGSVTKTFTALLLASMVVDGRAALDDPVSKYLPAASGLGTRLVDLACHTSGFPRIPLGVKLRMLLRLRDPYALVRDRHVDRSLRKLSRQLGPGPHQFRYSNFGYGVLARALAAAGGRPFGTLLREEVLGPLGLEEVTLETDPDPDRRRLFGHDSAGNELEHWHNSALAGAGFLFSTIGGMRRYLTANLQPAATALEGPLELVHQPRHPAATGMQVALGWLVRDTEHGPLHWHNGGTAGFGSFIGFDLERQVGVAVLVSRRHGLDLDEAAVGAISEMRRQ
ncbi:MAG: serine hydrolase domain-containing protein [Acidimicrobiales bacterium]